MGVVQDVMQDPGPDARFAFTTKDFAFRHHGDRPLLGRWRQPDGEGPFPAVVDVHGGGWHAGDYNNDQIVLDKLAESGIASFALDFRQPPSARFPDPISDIHAGIRWIKAHAEELGTTAELIGGVGMSTGGHMLMLCAMQPNDPRYSRYVIDAETTTDSRLRYAVLFTPIVDPLARYRMTQEDGGEHNEHLAEGHMTFWDSEAQMEEANPQRILDRGEATDLPPVLVCQAAADVNVTPDMADKFNASYRAAGGEAELEKYENTGHTFVRDLNTPAALAAFERMRQYIWNHSL